MPQYQNENPLQNPLLNDELDLEAGDELGQRAFEAANMPVANLDLVNVAGNDVPLFGAADDALDVRRIPSELSFFEAYMLTITKNTLDILMLGMIAQSCIVPLALLAGGLKIYNDALTQADGYNKSQGLTGYALEVANAKAAYYMLQGFLATYPLLIKIITNSTTVGLVLVDMFKHAIGVPREYRAGKILVPSTRAERIAAGTEPGHEKDFFGRIHRAAGRDHNEHTWSYWLWQTLHLQELSPIFWVFAAVDLVTVNTQMAYTGNETYKNFGTNYDKAWPHLTNTTEYGSQCVAPANTTLSAGQDDTCDAIANQNALFLTTKQNMANIAKVTWTALGLMGFALVMIAIAELVYKLYEFRFKDQDSRTKGLPVFTTVGAITENLLIYLIVSYAAFSYMTQSEALVDGVPRYDDWYDTLLDYNANVLEVSDPETLARSQAMYETEGYLNGKPLQNAVMVSEGILAAGLVEIAINIYLMARYSPEWRHSFTHDKLASWLTTKAFHDRYLSRLPSVAHLNLLARVLASIVVTGIFANNLVIDPFGRDAYLGRYGSKYSDEKDAGICVGSDSNMKCRVNAYANGLAYLFQSFAELLNGFMGGVLLYGPVVGAAAVCSLVYVIISCYRQPAPSAENLVELPNFVGEERGARRRNGVAMIGLARVAGQPVREDNAAVNNPLVVPFVQNVAAQPAAGIDLEEQVSDDGLIHENDGYVPPASPVYINNSRSRSGSSVLFNLETKVDDERANILELN